MLRDDAIIASNTSSISISVLASYFSEKRQDRFLGLHFFSPVSRMKLVEVIRGFDVSDEAVEIATEAVKAVGKVPIIVKDVVGFAVNRVLFAMWNGPFVWSRKAHARRRMWTQAVLGLGHPVGPRNDGQHLDRPDAQGLRHPSGRLWRSLPHPSDGQTMRRQVVSGVVVAAVGTVTTKKAKSWLTDASQKVARQLHGFA